jgi:hypothetical protein
MKLNITEGKANEAKIQKAIGKVLTHGTSLRQMQDFAYWAEKELAELDLPKTKRAGARVSFYSGGFVARAYKWARKSQSVTLARGNSGWFLVQCYEIAQYRNEGHERDLYLTQKQRDIVVGRFTSQFRVLKETS